MAETRYPSFLPDEEDSSAPSIEDIYSCCDGYESDLRYSLSQLAPDDRGRPYLQRQIELVSGIDNKRAFAEAIIRTYNIFTSQAYSAEILLLGEKALAERVIGNQRFLINRRELVYQLATQYPEMIWLNRLHQLILFWISESTGQSR